jgi:hypothetical protein
MGKHKVDSSNIKAGVFDDSVLPSIFAKIIAAEKADLALKQPNRYFRVSVKKGEEPVRIVADTLIDAECQAEDLARHFGSEVFEMYEVFPLEFSGSLARLNDHMKNIFS